MSDCNLGLDAAISGSGIDVKPVEAAKQLMPDAALEIPYEGAKEMLLVDDVDNRKFFVELCNAMYEELPAPKEKK